MTHRIPIFLASAHYGLEDLRGELSAFITELGGLPLVSSEKGFPDFPGVSPYAQCLRVLENSLIVLGVIDRRYGQSYSEWDPYPEYNGLSATHAELRHALRIKKRLIVYARNDVLAFYEVYRKNRGSTDKFTFPDNLELKTLEMLYEVKHAKPAPWIESFMDVRSIKESLQKRLLGDLYEALVQRERLVAVGASTLIDQMLKLQPDLLERLASRLEGMSPEQQAILKTKLDRSDFLLPLGAEDRISSRYQIARALLSSISIVENVPYPENALLSIGPIMLESIYRIWKGIRVEQTEPFSKEGNSLTKLH